MIGRSKQIVSSSVKRQQPASREVAMRNKSLLNGLLILLIVVVFALTYVWTRIKVIQLSYDVTRLQGEINRFEQEELKFESEVARLKAPGRLDQIARSYFGMRPPAGDEMMFVPGR
ncbi:MAG: cell division protein FtsL [Pseudomonadota bacterium]